MPLVKLRNKTATIIFVDSLNLTIRPSKSPNDFILMDEAKMSEDAQLSKCVLIGMLEKCTMDQQFVDKKVEEKKKEVEVQKTQELEGRVKSIKNPKVKIPEKKIEKKNADSNIVEPKNTKSVVFAGINENGDVKIADATSIKHAEIPMPGFLKEEDITDMNMDDLDLENKGEKDIIYADMKGI